MCWTCLVSTHHALEAMRLVDRKEEHHALALLKRLGKGRAIHGLRHPQALDIITSVNSFSSSIPTR